MCSIPFWAARASSASLRTHLGSLGCETIGTDNVVVSTVSLDEIRNRTYSVLRDVATSKLASFISSVSAEAQAGTNLKWLRLWASWLTAESRDPGWFVDRYFWPESIQRARRLLKASTKGLVCVVGLQGIGKTSALRALYFGYVRSKDPIRVSYTSDNSGNEYPSAVILKWRRDLFKTAPTDREYCPGAFDEIYSQMLGRRQFHNAYDGRKMRGGDEVELTKRAWIEMLSKMSLILIDMPDYSRTDKRRMARDLEDVHSLWSTLLAEESEANIVMTVQKEMMGGHFFLNKMHVIEIEPLSADQVAQLYLNTFHGSFPYTRDALKRLAVMSRGNFRNFLRYITQTLDSWESLPEPKGSIDLALVQRTITTDQLVEDMEVQLGPVFPKGSDLRLQAVRLVMFLEESGPKRQAELVEEFGLEEYAMSRLLAKLELHRYIARRREGTDKIVSLRSEM
jgi:hypothetical protein